MQQKNELGLDRRRFLGSSALGAAATLTAPAWLPRVTLAGTRGTARDTLVVVFLRGGMDGLTVCAPTGDANYAGLRPTIGIAPPSGTNGVVALDALFSLPAAGAALNAQYLNGTLAFVHATGLSDLSRSHFDKQKWMEFGVTGASSAGVTSGWLGRYLQTIAPIGSGLLRGLAVENTVPRSLAGGPACTAVPDPANFAMPGSAATAAARRAALDSMYSDEPFPLGPSALNAFATIDLLATIDFDNYVPSNGAVYPTTSFGAKLKAAAAILKANLGVEAIEADLGGWDHHNQQGPTGNGTMATLLGELAAALAAFEADLSDASGALDRTTLVCMSEFGRRARENASAGTDHGYGGLMLVMGGHVNGGQVITNWPTLAPAALLDGDLAITIDYRDVLAEVLADRMSATNLAAVFPSYTPAASWSVTR